MPEKAPALIALTTDLFLQSRIKELADSLRVEAAFAQSSDLLPRTLTSQTTLVILDLSATEYDPFTVARTLKANNPSLRVLGFFPHVRTELKTKAETAGVDVVVPNSKFLETLRRILKEADT